MSGRSAAKKDFSLEKSEKMHTGSSPACKPKEGSGLFWIASEALCHGSSKDWNPGLSTGLNGFFRNKLNEAGLGPFGHFKKSPINRTTDFLPKSGQADDSSNNVSVE